MEFCFGQLVFFGVGIIDQNDGLFKFSGTTIVHHFFHVLCTVTNMDFNEIVLFSFGYLGILFGFVVGLVGGNGGSKRVNSTTILAILKIPETTL